MFVPNATFAYINKSFGNQTKWTHDSFYHEHPALRATRLVLLTVIFIVGILGNFLVCFVTSRKRGQTSAGNLLILHLAVADLGILFVNFPFVVIRSEFPYSWPFGQFICRTIYPFGDIFYGVEIGCITAIAIHRYKMLVHCTKPQITLESAKKIVFIIWLFSFLFIVVPMIFVMDLKMTNHLLDCGPLWPNKISEQVFSINSCLMFYIIPLVVILVTYIKIRGVLKGNTKRQNSYRLSRGESARGNNARMSQNRRAIQILTPVLIMFTISMFPFTAFRFFAVFSSSEILASFKYTRLIFNISCILLISNSSVNPIIYSVANSEFRREFSSHLKCNGDSCCLETSEKLTTVQKTDQPVQNPDRRGNSEPLEQDCVINARVVGQNANSTDDNITLLANTEDTRCKPSSSHLSIIKVNPTYETGGF